MAHAEAGELLFVYGTLLSGKLREQAPEVAAQLEYVGPRTIPGVLYDLGPYPGLKLEVGVVKGELYRALSPSVLAALDGYEGYDRNDAEASLYCRTRLRCAKHTSALLQWAGGDPQIDVWVYVYNQPVDSYPRIHGGCWRAHRDKLGRGEGE